MHANGLTNASCFWTFLTTAIFFSSLTASEESCAIPMSAITSTESSPFGSLLKYHMERNPESGYVTLATVENSKPRARTVLFQGLADLPDGSIGICIKTHAASNKIVLADSKAVEIVWWMDRTAVQFRFSGDIAYDNEKERRRVWNSLHDGAKSQFFYSPPSGASKLDTSTRGPFFQEERVKARKDGMNGPPPSTFVVGVLVPEQVDFLDLSTLKRSNWIRKKVCGKFEAEKPLHHHWIENSGYAPPVISTTTTTEQ
jgi:hypothetical protein